MESLDLKSEQALGKPMELLLQFQVIGSAAPSAEPDAPKQQPKRRK